MDNFDFVGLLRMLQCKGYELCLYPGERDELHIKLTDWDRDTGYAFNVKEVVSLRAIEQYRTDPTYVLYNILSGLMKRLNSRTEGFRHYAESIGNSDDNEI